MFGSQLVGCLERIRECGFVRGDVSLGVGFEVSKAHAKVSVSVCLSVCLSVPISWPTACESDMNSQLLLQHHAVAMLLATMVTESPSETVSKPLVKSFLL